MLSVLPLHFWIPCNAHSRTLNAGNFTDSSTGSTTLHASCLKRVYVGHWAIGNFIEKRQIQAILKPVYEVGNQAFRHNLMDMGATLCGGTCLRSVVSLLNFKVVPTSLYVGRWDLRKGLIKAGEGFVKNDDNRFRQENIRPPLREWNWMPVERRAKW